MFNTIILAAGESKRKKSAKSKVLHDVLFQPLIKWVIDAAKDADNHIVVIGHCADQVRDALGDSVEYVEQKDRLGTGHADMQAKT